LPAPVSIDACPTQGAVSAGDHGNLTQVNKGVIGIASFLGGESTPSQAVVLSAGTAYRLGANRLQGEFEHDGALPHLLLRYALALAVQTGHNAVCNRLHSLEQRLCRWILSCLDRLATNELTMTQKLIADMLGVRREGVSLAAGKLQAAGLIHCGRGRIAVLDRPRLEERACECYAVVKRESDRLLLPEDSERNAGAHNTRRPYRWRGEEPAQPELT
jgi:hypothetical protein